MALWTATGRGGHLVSDRQRTRHADDQRRRRPAGCIRGAPLTRATTARTQSVVDNTGPYRYSFRSGPTVWMRPTRTSRSRRRASPIVADQSLVQDFRFAAGTLRVHVSRQRGERSVRCPPAARSQRPDVHGPTAPPGDLQRSDQRLLPLLASRPRLSLRSDHGCMWDMTREFLATPTARRRGPVLVPTGTYAARSAARIRR